jgi:hypothetical protein
MTKMTNQAKNEKISLSISTFYDTAKHYSAGSKKQLHTSLWEMVCDDLDLDYEDETNGQIFDTIMEEYK